jgi:hypothetical protein
MNGIVLQNIALLEWDLQNEVLVLILAFWKYKVVNWGGGSTLFQPQDLPLVRQKPF